jgi:hypothetical protein
MGDFDSAEREFTLAIDVWSHGLSPRHAFVARGLEALAGLAARRGQPRRAQALYGEALAIQRASLGDGHPLVAWTRVNLARVLGDLGFAGRAHAELRTALAIYATAGSAGEPDHLARALEVQGELFAAGRQFADARTRLRLALEERVRIFGPAHPLVAETRKELADVDYLRGALAEAVTGALEVERVGRDSLRRTIRYLPERQAVRYAARRPRGLDLALSIATASHVQSTRLILDAVIRSRGVILDEMAAREQATENGDPQVRALAGAASAA